jgi:glycosyltransferase involved in cell wall biosynthesis
MNKKVVMLLSNSYNPDDRVRNEALALIEVGYDVTILAWDRDGTHPVKEMLSGVIIRRINFQAGYGQGSHKMLAYLKVWRWFLKELNQIRPIVIHCHDYDTYLAGVWYVWTHQRINLVLDTHENYYMMMKPLVSTQAAFVVGLLERTLTGIADLLISSNQATADYYGRFGAKKVIVVGNWKNPQAYNFGMDVITKKRQEIGIAPTQLVMVYIGALSEDRNVLALLQAIRARPNVFLILGGRGDQDYEIRNACSTMQNVYFPGYIHPDEVPLFTASADVVYYCFDPDNIYAPYNAPNKLYEALAAGKVILASDLGGELSRVIKTVQCGILLSHVAPETIGDAIDLLWQESIRSVMQGRSKEAGQLLYNWQVAKNKLQGAYNNLLLYPPNSRGTTRF